MLGMDFTQVQKQSRVLTQGQTVIGVQIYTTQLLYNCYTGTSKFANSISEPNIRYLFGKTMSYYNAYIKAVWYIAKYQ